MNSSVARRRALAAALTLVFMTSGSTALSSLFVIYIKQWGLTSVDVAVVFSVYVGTLLPVLLLFGGLAERFGRRPIAFTGILSMALGLVLLIFAHSLPSLIVARLFQGAGVGFSVGAVTAALAESYRGKLPSGNMLQSVAAFGLFTGPVISAIVFNLGGGLSFSYVPALAMVIGVLALVPLLAERTRTPVAAPAVEEPYSSDVVSRALRLALPLAFVSWAALSLFLSLVPAYLAATLHAVNPVIGAGAILASQLASLVATLRLGNVAPERSGILGAIVSIAGLAMLIIGTSANIWFLVGLATVLVGAGGGIASAAAFGIAGRIGRGQRARVFARMYVAAYAGYSIPALAIGLIAVHTSFAMAFIVVTAVLAMMTAALPLLRERRPAGMRELAPAA